jgi:hypothetical protein
VWGGDTIGTVPTSRFAIGNRMAVKYCNGMKNKLEDLKFPEMVLLVDW